MRFLVKGAVPQQLRRLLASHQGEACLGLFAAADALQLGHVSGVPPYVYVQKLPRSGEKKWGALLIASPGDVPDLILRQAPSPNSIFRAAVHRDDLVVADVIQTWLDVANHPSRGEEQADLIYKKILHSVITADPEPMAEPARLYWGMGASAPSIRFASQQAESPARFHARHGPGVCEQDTDRGRYERRSRRTWIQGTAVWGAHAAGCPLHLG
jgi:hypothetical protein